MSFLRKTLSSGLVVSLMTAVLATPYAALAANVPVQNGQAPQVNLQAPVNLLLPGGNQQGNQLIQGQLNKVQKYTGIEVSKLDMRSTKLDPNIAVDMAFTNSSDKDITTGWSLYFYHHNGTQSVASGNNLLVKAGQTSAITHFSKVPVYDIDRIELVVDPGNVTGPANDLKKAQKILTRDVAVTKLSVLQVPNQNKTQVSFSLVNAGDADASVPYIVERGTLKGAGNEGVKGPVVVPAGASVPVVFYIGYPITNLLSVGVTVDEKNEFTPAAPQKKQMLSMDRSFRFDPIQISEGAKQTADITFSITNTGDYDIATDIGFFTSREDKPGTLGDMIKDVYVPAYKSVTRLYHSNVPLDKLRVVDAVIDPQNELDSKKLMTKSQRIEVARLPVASNTIVSDKNGSLSVAPFIGNNGTFPVTTDFVLYVKTIDGKVSSYQGTPHTVGAGQVISLPSINIREKSTDVESVTMSVDDKNKVSAQDDATKKKEVLLKRTVSLGAIQYVAGKNGVATPQTMITNKSEFSTKTNLEATYYWNDAKITTEQIPVELGANETQILVLSFPKGDQGDTLDSVQYVLDPKNVYQNDAKQRIQKLSVSTCSKIKDRNSCVAVSTCGWGTPRDEKMLNPLEPDNTARLFSFDNNGYAASYLEAVNDDGSVRYNNYANWYDTCSTYSRPEQPATVEPTTNHSNAPVKTLEPVLSWTAYSAWTEIKYGNGRSFELPALDADSTAMNTAAEVYSLFITGLKKNMPFFRWKVMDVDGKVVWQRNFSEPKESPVNHCSLIVNGTDQDGYVYVKANYWLCPFAKVPAGILHEGQKYTWVVESTDLPAIFGNSRSSGYSAPGKFEVAAQVVVPQKNVGYDSVALDPVELIKGQQGTLVQLTARSVANNVINSSITVNFQKPKGETVPVSLPVKIPVNGKTVVSAVLPAGTIDRVDAVLDQNADFGLIKGGTKTQTIGISTCGKIQDRNTCVATPTCGWSDGTGSNKDPANPLAGELNNFDFGFGGWKDPGQQQDPNANQRQVNVFLKPAACVTYQEQDVPWLYAPTKGAVVTSPEPVLSWYKNKVEADKIKAAKQAGLLDPNGFAYIAPEEDTDALTLDGIATKLELFNLKKHVLVYRWKLTDLETGSIVWQRDFSDKNETPVHVCSLLSGGDIFWVCPFVKVPANILKKDHKYAWTVEEGDLVSGSGYAKTSGYAVEETFSTSQKIAPPLLQKNDVPLPVPAQPLNQVSQPAQNLGIPSPFISPRAIYSNGQSAFAVGKSANTSPSLPMVLAPRTPAQEAVAKSVSAGVTPAAAFRGISSVSEEKEAAGRSAAELRADTVAGFSGGSSSSGGSTSAGSSGSGSTSSDTSGGGSSGGTSGGSSSGGSSGGDGGGGNAASTF